MNRITSSALLIVGTILIIYGVGASDSVSSSLSRMFTGAPTDRTFWFLIGGGTAAFVGLMGMLVGPKSSR
jgi:hypothetical protein